MKTALKASLISTTLAMLFSIPASEAETPRECRDAYRACLAAGYNPFDCENGYWYCLYGYIPVKSSALPVVSDRRY